MSDKEFKYKQYLEKYKNCPPEDYIERSLLCYRWVHAPATTKDLIPLSLHPDIPARQFDDSDILCMSYGLSMFKDLNSATKRYLHLYNKSYRQTVKDRFKSEKGENVVSIQIEKEDGVSNEPNNEGHFTFHEYANCQLLEKIKDKFDIFVS